MNASHREAREAAAACGVAFQAPGFARRLRGGCRRGALVAPSPCARVQSHAACCVALRAVGCCVLLGFHRSSVRWVLPDVAGCFGLASVLPHCVVGPRSRDGFPS